jgi:hypothetical protein
MADLRKLITLAQSALTQRRVDVTPVDPALSESVRRLCSLGELHGPYGVRRLVGRMDANSLTDDDRQFLEGLPVMQDHTPESLARMLVQLDDEV